MIKRLIKKTIFYKPLCSLLKKYRKCKKNKKEIKEKKKKLKQEKLDNMLTYAKVEKIINDRFRKTHDFDINFENPISFTDKMNYSKLYNATKTKTRLTDKVLVRDWVKKRIGAEHLVPIIGIYDNLDDIDFKKLPKEYVIKCSHDSGSTVLVDKEHKLDKKELYRKYDYYMRRNLASYNYEMHYRDIEPKIIVEKYLGFSITEIKFLCFDGKIYCCWEDFDRHTSRNVYDANWNLKNLEILYPANPRKTKPKHFDEMKILAEKLAKGFDQVRVDLFEVNDVVYFNEMTFTSGNGAYTFKPEEGNLELGEQWKLNTRKRKKMLNKEVILTKNDKKSDK